MALCGHAGVAPSTGPAPLAARANALAVELGVRTGAGVRMPPGAALLGERAALLGLGRRGRSSPGGSCRLLPTIEGFVALTLARPDDLTLLPAWLEREVDPGADAWDVVARALRARSSREWVNRGRLLGLPVAEAVVPSRAPEPGVRVHPIGVPRARALDRPLVVDLSSLWAGPLCTHLLGLGGARVLKVESTARPDGARRGPQAFFDLLNAGKASVALDFRSPRDRTRLARLMERADVVVEASRPRALRQLGIDAEAILAERPGLVWASITGYGRDLPGGDWTAFGDDAAVAAGLAMAAGTVDDPVFCADAVADPLAGLYAALETWRALERGGGCLLDVSMARVARDAFGDGPAPGARVLAEHDAWFVSCEGSREPVAAPRARRPAGRAHPLGADTEAVLRELRC